MNRKVLIGFSLSIILISVLGLIWIPRLVDAETPTLKLISPPGPHPVTETINVLLQIDGATDLGAYELTLQFDPTYVTFIDFDRTDHIGDLSASCDPDVSRCTVPLGPITSTDQAAFGAYTFGTGSGPDGFGTLGTIHLTPTGQGGTTQLELTAVLISDTMGNTVVPAVQNTILDIGLEHKIYLPLINRQ